jgi:tetratricopeptide (TPR) repeat protein
LKKVLIYLPLEPEKAKINNLPVKLPVLLEDLEDAKNSNNIDLNLILRGLEAQYKINPADEYYSSYYMYYLFEKAKKCINDNELIKAQKILEKTRTIKEDYRYFFFLGLIEVKEVKIDIAEILFKKALAISKNFYPALYELGKICKLKEEYEDAVEYFSRSITASNNNFLLPLIDIIDCYLESGEYNNALYIIENLNDKFPFKEEILLRKGIIYNEQQKFSNAAKTFSEGLKISNDWKLFYNRSFSFLKLGELYKSYTDLKKAMEISNFIEIEYEMGLIQKKMGFFENSLNSLQNYFKNSNDEKALYGMVRLLINLSRFEEAEKLILDHKMKAITDVLEKFKNIYFINPYKSNLSKNRFDLILKNFGNRIDKKVNYEEIIKNLALISKSKRITNMKMGVVSEPSEFEYSLIIFYLENLIKIFPDFNELELFSYRFPFIVSGKGNFTAVCRIMLLIVKRLVFIGVFDFRNFLDEIIEEIKDLSFPLASNVSKLNYQRLIDLDTALEMEPISCFKFLIKIFSILENNGYNEAIDRNDELSFFFKFLKKIKDVI